MAAVESKGVYWMPTSATGGGRYALRPWKGMDATHYVRHRACRLPQARTLHLQNRRFLQHPATVGQLTDVPELVRSEHAPQGSHGGEEILGRPLW